MDVAEELASAISQVAVLDNKIRELNKNRAALLQNINYLQSPMVSRLQPEVLSRIFWFATRPAGAGPYPRLSDTKRLFDLYAVCSHWRSIIQSSPQLWTILVLEKKRSEGQTSATDYVALVRHQFQRLGAATISVYISDLSPLASATIGEVVQILLEEYPEKLRTLYLSGNMKMSVWPHMFECNRENVKFSQLEELKLIWLFPKLEQQQTLFRNVPCLQTLLLHGGGDWQAMFELPWRQITTLRIYGTRLEDLFQVLSICPNLVYCEIRNHSKSDEPWAPEQSQIIPMRFVLGLAWTPPGEDLGYLNPVGPEFFTRFRFPAIRELEWQTALPSNASFVRDFFAAMQELEALKFSLLKIPGYCIDQCVEVFGNLRILDANVLGYRGQELRQWLHRLTVKPGGNSWLPRLESLHLTMGFVTPDELVVVLHSRRSSPVDWSSPEQDHTELELLPYDPNSPHWQHHVRLLEFSCKYRRDAREQDRGWGPYSDALKNMIKEAKEVEGFEQSYDYSCRIRF